MVFHRERPDDAPDHQYNFFSSNASHTNAAFSSGHATNAFSWVTVVTKMYQDDNPWVGWVLYPLAFGTSMSRLNADRHWTSDIVAGSILGYAIGAMVVRFNPFDTKRRLSIAAHSIGGAPGVSVKLRY